MKNIPFLLLALSLSVPGLANKKDFKGLFGSYQRERFTENEANSSDFGIDLGISTLTPLTGVVNSSTTRGGAGDPMYSSSFFNVEAAALYSLWYHWQFYASIGHYGYETRKDTPALSLSDYPAFHVFEFSAIPMILGLRYRMTVDDIVPYVGIGAGMSFVKRKASYDSSTLKDEESLSVITGQVQAGVEFYFSPRAGLRLEVAGYYFNIPARTYDPSGPIGNASNNPIFNYQANIWSLRYSSGLFFLL